ncbi:hypothetical protein GJ697_02950 [Pseudoduganella sp. FT25W]|uniref:Peptidase C14 caspase domain-containing protein n=1 Tax=Duganella alba TaxID=2666081 RepID=A0A6L5QAR0_9BURK|nr:caspase family protein [Duganella alba]MRX06786.1 hypothetical protein [Duganella alba]MRX18412.1 hypothetical protein [Duganella alba]
MKTRDIGIISIGINKYNNLQSLGFCASDSKKIVQAFGNRTQINSYEHNDEAQPASIDDVRYLIKSTSEASKNCDGLIFFFAGHGFSQEGKDYLACTDTDISNLNTAISTDEVIAELVKSGVKDLVLIVDACRQQVDRSVADIFGERTAELARRSGVVTFFACSPKQTAKELQQLDSGIFTYSFCSLMNDKSIAFTPLAFARPLIDSVAAICKQHNLSTQTPYTAVAPIEKAEYDLITGKLHSSLVKKREMILIVGPTNAGKSTIGQHLANRHGYVHAEMSSFAWKRLDQQPNFRGNMQDFMEKEVWIGGNEDAIARDMLVSIQDQSKVVVCGARRMEEIETIENSEWDVRSIFIFSDTNYRFQRQKHATGRFGLSYTEFIKKDLKEFAWGIANMSGMKNIELVLNEDSVEKYTEAIEEILGCKD